MFHHNKKSTQEMSNEKLTNRIYVIKYKAKKGVTMKIKNLLVADIKRLKEPLIVKQPSIFRRVIASCIGADIIVYKEALSNTKIKIDPYDLKPLCFYIDTNDYEQDIAISQLKKLQLKKEFNQKRKIGF